MYTVQLSEAQFEQIIAFFDNVKSYFASLYTYSQALILGLAVLVLITVVGYLWLASR